MSHHVVCVCPLELFDYILQLAAMALCAEEPLETALALLHDVRNIAFDSLHVSRWAQYTSTTGVALLADAPR